jgi:hypothetical protein
MAQIPLGELDEDRPVGRGRMSAGVLAEADIAIDQRGLDGRKFACAKIFLAYEPVDGPAPTPARKDPLASTHPSPSVVPV